MDVDIWGIKLNNAPRGAFPTIKESLGYVPDVIKESIGQRNVHQKEMLWEIP